MVDFRWSRDGRTLTRDAALAAAMAVACIAPLSVVRSPGFFWPAALWSLLMCSAIVVRRVMPLGALGIAAVAGVGMVFTVSTPLPAILAIPVVIYSVARYHRLSALSLVIPFAVVGSIAGPFTWTRQLAPGYRFLGTAVLVLLCLAIVALAYLTGRLLRERIRMEALDFEIVTERFAAAQRQNAQENQLAVGRARAEVAQELHDVLAHSLSVIVVQAEGAKALTTKRPEAAQEALRVIAETGRNSIGEVRRIVSLMRGEDEPPAFGPAPSLSQVAELVDTAGSRISLTVEGEPPLVPESLGLAAFRVVQEAVTNFLKHAGPTARAEVSITYHPEAIDILVRDDGIGVLSTSDGHGSGVRGMRERVTAMGGSFHAGPRAGGGYEVRARLPLPSRLGTSWLREDT